MISEMLAMALQYLHLVPDIPEFLGNMTNKWG
jgi:hypothetical protein